MKNRGSNRVPAGVDFLAKDPKYLSRGPSRGFAGDALMHVRCGTYVPKTLDKIV